jgi:hypothetical protein
MKVFTMKMTLCVCAIQLATSVTAGESIQQSKAKEVVRKEVQCSVDLSKPGQMSDILSTLYCLWTNLTKP